MESQDLFNNGEEEAIGGDVSYLPFKKTDELNIGQNYRIKKLSFIQGRYGPRIRVTTDTFLYDLPERFKETLKNYDLNNINYTNAYFRYEGKTPAGRYQ